MGFFPSLAHMHVGSVEFFAIRDLGQRHVMCGQGPDRPAVHIGPERERKLTGRPIETVPAP